MYSQIFGTFFMSSFFYECSVAKTSKANLCLTNHNQNNTEEEILFKDLIHLLFSFL